MSTNGSSEKYFCCVCHKFAAPRFASVVRHIGSVHSCEPNLHLTCGIEGCPRTYSSYRCFRKHLRSKHREFLEQPCDEQTEQLPDPFILADTDIDPEAESSFQSMSQTAAQEPFSARAAALFLLKAKEKHRISQLALDGLVGDFSEILDSAVKSFSLSTKECLQTANCSTEIISKVELVFNSYRNPFLDLQTAHLQQKYYTRYFNLIEPVERRLGQSSQRFVKENNSCIKQTWDLVYDVPLISSIQQLLSDEHILDEVLRGHCRQDDIMEDYCDGLEFKRHALFSSEPHSLQIMLYFDEVELCNPLGSSSKIHKIGVFYYQLGNISPQYRSSLRSIQLVAVAECSIILKYGSNKILEPFMADIHKLEQDDGVIFSLEEDRKFRGTLTLVSGDNLASNYIGGYKQLSSALRKCRFCMAVGSDMREKFFAEDFQPRTQETHRLHCENLGGHLHDHFATTYGIHHDSILNSSQFYHVTEGLPPDIMHDILEGALQYEVKELLKYLIDKKSLSFEVLNERIRMFPYVYPDKNNKPTPISLETLKSSNHQLKQNASKMWCMGRLLPLMIGDLVPEDDEKWKLFLLLLTIIDYVFAPRTTGNSVAYVRMLINDHHVMFTELYPECNVIPKMHYMVHIPSWMERCGPMTRYWCMRYEAKHSYFKDLAQKIKNFKNISKSLAERHQRLVCYQFLGSQSLVKELATGKVIKSIMEDLPYYDALIQSSLLPSRATDIHRTKWVQCNGVVYSIGCVVVLSTAPTFGQLHDILLTEVDVCIFVCNILVTEGYVDHLHAFEVHQEKPTPLTFCKQRDLTDYHPLGLYNLNGSLYVIPKYYIEE